MCQKQIFDDESVIKSSDISQQAEQEWQFQAQQIFHPEETLEVALDLNAEQEINQHLESVIDPYLPIEEELRPSTAKCWKKRVLQIIGFLFGGAVLAQAIQWLVDSWQQHQWIYFALSISFSLLLVLVLFEIMTEWRQLKRLQRLEQTRQESMAFFLDEFQLANNHQFERAVAFCEEIIKRNKSLTQNIPIAQWRQQLNPAQKGTEVLWLFSQNILKPLDQQAQALISRNAIETSIMVAVSPVALIDMLLIAWRNIRLLRQIAGLYGVELGYISRIRLLKMVLFNIAFAGTTELIQEVGMDWLSQDITAKLSSRMAQGLGVGLLTARLGLKAVEFCRPIVFRNDEKIKLNGLHKILLSELKQQILRTEKYKPERKNEI
ncbi:TIGR01620 family protein [Mergibacter septicus]|uniref:YcjF family protein n=1 Tax=Mergibacter septicus TaxID=221402 RepID=UPI00117928A7|nr:TIGR01620 family protein [Mergibacter septicus]AWX13116.1 TIGR01620 family protein [Mergibacter septicus]